MKFRTIDLVGISNHVCGWNRSCWIRPFRCVRNLSQAHGNRDIHAWLTMFVKSRFELNMAVCTETEYSTLC
ncbi:MAG: hypothetical protein ACYSUY_14210, partial [Planctomycetota bacterium]